MIPPILRRVAALGHTVFERPFFNLNLIAERAPAAVPDAMDDLLHVWRIMPNGQWECVTWPCTTDPTSYWLAHPMRPEGTAILVPGQYPRSHAPGLHHGRPALVQVGPVRVWRDANRDEVADYRPGCQGFPGVYGINIHGPGGLMARASAGCIVLGRQEYVDELLSMVQHQCDTGLGSRVSLTLVEA